LRRLRTLSQSSHHKSCRKSYRKNGRNNLCSGLLALMLAGSGAPAAAQEESASGVRDQSPVSDVLGDVRGAVSSGLGEWGLSRRFPEAALWLDLEGDARTLALFWPETELPARGALIVLADEGENAESGLAGPLARELAGRRFAVLTLGLAPPPAALEQTLEAPRTESEAEPEEALVEARTEIRPGEQNQSANNTATIDVMALETVGGLEDAYRERIREELAAGAAELAKRDYELIAVVGLGRGSNHVVSYAAAAQASPALIWVAPRFYPRDASEVVATLGSASVPRILELSSFGEGMQRKADLERAGVEGFSLQSVGANASFTSRNGKALAGRISAWLRLEQ